MMEETPSDDDQQQPSLLSQTEDESLAVYDNQQFPDTAVSDSQLQMESEIPQNETMQVQEELPEQLTTEAVTAHNEANPPVMRPSHADEMDATLNATRNSNSVDGEDDLIESFPETVDDLAREETTDLPQIEKESATNDDEDDIERRDELATISEQESLSVADRSAMILAEHNKQAKSEEKQNQILSSLTKKTPLPNSFIQSPNKSITPIVSGNPTEAAIAAAAAADQEYKYQQDATGDESGIRKDQEEQPPVATNIQLFKQKSAAAPRPKSAWAAPAQQPNYAPEGDTRQEKYASRLYQQAEINEKKRLQRKQELDDREMSKIEEAKKTQKEWSKKQVEIWGMEDKKSIHKRVDQMIDIKTEKIKGKQDLLAEARMRKQVTAEFHKRVDEERSKGGAAAAAKFKKLFGTSEEDIQGYLHQQAKQEIIKESVAKEKAIIVRADELESEQKLRSEEAQGNKEGIMAFGSKSAVFNPKTKQQLTIQARREVEKDWSYAPYIPTKAEKTANKSALSQKYAQIKATFEERVQEMKVKSGSESAERWKRQFGATDKDLNSFLMTRARDELEKEKIYKEQDLAAKEQSIKRRVDQLRREQDRRIKEEKAKAKKTGKNGGSNKLTKEKTLQQLTAQARKEINAEEIVAKQEARQDRQKEKWRTVQQNEKRQKDLRDSQEITFKPKTNANSSTIQMQKAYRQQYIAENQPSQISQVYSTGFTLEANMYTSEKNPFTAVQRLYERAEESKVKQEFLGQHLFQEKYKFKPAVYSERPPENPYLTTYNDEEYGELPPFATTTAAADLQKPMTSTQFLNQYSSQQNGEKSLNLNLGPPQQQQQMMVMKNGTEEDDDGYTVGNEVQYSPHRDLLSKMDEFQQKSLPQMPPIKPVVQNGETPPLNQDEANLQVIEENDEITAL